MYQDVEPTIDATGLCVGMAVSRYHGEITGRLSDAAVSAFVRAGGQRDDVLMAPAPGAFELVVVSRALAVRGDLDAIVALGCVVRGETTHDQHICSAVAHGLAELSSHTGVPVAFGVLTCQSLAQAEARAGGDKGDKGAEAMVAAIEAANTIRALRRAPASPSSGSVGVS